MPELRTYSLHRRLIVWLVIPVLVIGIAILSEAYLSARDSAQAIYDRLLLGLAFSISEHTVITEGDLLSDEVLDIMTQRTSDTIAYRVTGPDGAFVTGLHGIPPIPANETIEGGVPIFYDAVHEGEPVRMVALSYFVEHLDFEGWLTVQVLQTMGERHAMVWQAVTRSGLRLAAVLLLAATFIWLGVSRGLLPLKSLERSIRERSPNDLSPIRQEVPEEIRHVIHALNNLLDRIAGHIRNTKAFVETASHQLRTPLAALTTRIELARRDAGTDWGRRAFDGIHLDTVRASRLADQLLSLARVEPEALGGGFEENIDLEDLCADVAREWVSRAIARGIDLELEAEAEGLIVEGNTALLCEVLNNLIDNALSYCPEGARITIRVGESSVRGAYLQVEDDGPGIPAHRRDDVFERFVRLDPGIGRGCGLGLSIVQEIVRIHCGELLLSAPPSGSGLVVRIELPKSQTGRLADDSHPS